MVSYTFLLWLPQREQLMRREKRAMSWVVYRTKLPGKELVVSVVCQQSEWELMDRSEPGRYTLVREKIPSEPEAERLARGTLGDTKIHLPSRS
jgi:hypothetical protein